MRNRLKYIRVVIGCVIMVHIGCSSKTSNYSSKPPNKTIGSIVQELEKELNVSLKETYNDAEDFVLLTNHLSTKDKLITENLNNIIIIRLEDNSVLFHERIQGGIAQWINLYEVEIFYPSGIPDFQRHVILNVKSGKKRLKNEM